MKSVFVTFLVLLVASLGYAQQWPGGPWMEAVVATDDAVHMAEASASWDGDIVTIKAGGHDIWGAADQFMYVFQEVSGDFDVTATLLSLENTNDWAKAGIMVRQNVEPGSPNVMVSPRALNDLVTFQWRPEADVDSSSERVTPEGATMPVTIRLTRTGDEYMGGWSLDGGATWNDPVTRDGVTPTPPAVVAMSDPLLIGIAVTSHAAGVITTAEVEILGTSTTAVEPEDKISLTWGSLKTQ